MTDLATSIVLAMNMDDLTPEQVVWLHRLRAKVQILNGWKQLRKLKENK